MPKALPAPKIPPVRSSARWAGWALALLLAACGGGGGGGEAVVAPPLAPPAADDGSFNDPTAYSSAGAASLAGAEEGAAVTQHRATVGGTVLAYTARAGHLIARDLQSAQALAKMFYVAYTLDGANAPARPVTFFFNGGPGSASVWLHLGSYGPKRLAVPVPRTDAARPFPLVDNAESLLDVTDLVFIDAVGAGLSTAIAPFVNRSFWGVDVDAALFRDFIRRWLEVNQREASPKFVFGESYGGPRAAILAHLLPRAGVRLDGIVLQSPALDYNSNCAIGARVSCAGYLPTYGAVGAFHARVAPPRSDIGVFVDELRGYAARPYGAAIDALLGGGAFPADLPGQLASITGLGSSFWTTQPNLTPDIYLRNLITGSILGRYDGRIAAAQGSELATGGDPSSALIGASFNAAINSHLRETLRYRSGSTYVLLGSAIESWNFTHAGRSLPDTVPDLAQALQLNPALRMLAVSGWHDLATPFHQTEIDLARLQSPGRVQVRNYAGGHMSYLDDSSRAQQKADLAAFIRGTAAAAAPPERPARRAAVVAVDRAGTPAAGVPVPESPLQTPMLDPWAPPANRGSTQR